MMEELGSLEDLLDLQMEDLEIDRLLHRRASLDELATYREAHEALGSIETSLEDVGGRLKDARLVLDRSEGELGIMMSKLNREERRLFAGGISARDAEHLRSEVAMLRRNSSLMEDEILELMESREAAEAEAASLEEEWADCSSDKDTLEAQIGAKWKVMDDEIARHDSRKAEIVPLIPAELLELYERLRPAKEGVAVGRLTDGICGGCHLRLSAAEQSTIAKSSPPRCLHCRRILVLL